MLQPTDGLLLICWLRKPLRIGGVVASGARLSRMMAVEVDTASPGPVVELGGGTGAITRALLDAGVPRERLIVLEREPELHRHLRERFPDLTVLEADAAQLTRSLRRLEIEAVGAVVSSLPMLSMPARLQRLILRQSFDLLGTDGAFIQYTYGLRAPVATARLADWGIEAREIGRSWRNLPPASVWRLERHGT